MMSVHLVPGPSGISFVTAGAGSPIGDIWLGYLGRASVAALSLISGFLLAGTFDRHGVLRIARDRARVLLVPMMVWNLIGVAAILAGTRLGLALAEATPQDLLTPLGLLDGVTGLAGPTVNLSLFFLRDLFASSVLLALLWPLLRRHLGLGLAVVLALTVFDATQPVIFRPAILLFMLAGCALRAWGFGIGDLATRRLAVPGLLATLAVFVLCQMSPGHDPWLAALQNLAKRALLVFAVVALALAIGRNRRLQAFFDRLEPVAFLSYLGHVLLAKALWIAFAAAGVTLRGPSYLLYFVGAPVLVFALALAVRPLVEALPAPLPLLLKGKAPEAAKRPAAAAPAPGPLLAPPHSP